MKRMVPEKAGFVGTKKPKLEIEDDGVEYEFDDPDQPVHTLPVLPPSNVIENAVLLAENTYGLTEEQSTRTDLLVAEWGSTYEINDTIGSGVFGNVFQVTDVEQKTKFALKVLKPLPDSRDVFNRETQIMKHISRVHHKNLVSIIQSGELTKATEKCTSLAILMNLCGPSVFGVISNVRKDNPNGYITFPIPDIQKLGSQLVEAMKQLERMKVYHLDVKPENIYFKKFDMEVTTQAEEFGTKILLSDMNIIVGDFGCSEFYKIAPNPAKKKSATVQTQNYRAPEIIMGLPYNNKSDVWSVGCILYEMYSGELLFYGNNYNDTEFVQFAMMQRVLCHQASPRMWREALKMKPSKVELSSEDVPYLKGRINKASLKVQPLCTNLRKGDIAGADLFAFLLYVFQIDPADRPTFHEMSTHEFLATIDNTAQVQE